MNTIYNIIDKRNGSIIGTAETLRGARKAVRQENAVDHGRYGYRAA